MDGLGGCRRFCFAVYTSHRQIESAWDRNAVLVGATYLPSRPQARAAQYLELADVAVLRKHGVKLLLRHIQGKPFDIEVVRLDVAGLLVRVSIGRFDYKLLARHLKVVHGQNRLLSAGDIFKLRDPSPRGRRGQNRAGQESDLSPRLISFSF